MKLKSIITFLYLLVTAPSFLFFEIEINVWLSFFLNYFIITGITNYHLNFEKNYSPFLSSYIVFTLLFFIISPIIQISSFEPNNSFFPNAYPFNASEIIFVNFLIFLFNLVFFLCYLIFKKRLLKARPKEEITSKRYTAPLFIIILFMLCVLILVFNYDFLLDEFSRSAYMKSEESVSSLLIRKKVLLLVPLGSIIVAYSYLKKKKVISTNTVVVFFILFLLLSLLIVFKNPLTEKRNALGPIYICLIFIFYPKLINSNSKFFLFMFISMIVFFPLVSAFTHLDATFNELLANPKVIISSFFKTGGLIDAFNTLHYDAYANILATIDYVSKHGFSFGYQILSAFLFFIPRSVWSSKPISTGEFIGNYLIEDYGFRYSNLSNPLLSEGYINFGIIGVLIMAFVLPYVIIKFNNWLNSNDLLKKIIAFYFAVHLVFLLRGDFTNGFSYFIGTFIGVFLIPKTLDRILSFLLLKKSNHVS